MQKLDIIIPHYNEPWQTGEKFFQMLNLQRGVDLREDIHVIVVHDGVEPFPDALFADFGYSVEQKRINHAGVSAARNKGLRTAKAEWVMFCDFDDMFSNVYSLRMIMNQLSSPDFDMISCNFTAEDMTVDGKMILHNRGQNLVFVHGKVFRRSMLEENGLFFPEDMETNQDSAFLGILNQIVDYRRTGTIKSGFGGLYVWTYRPESTTSTAGNWGKCVFGLWQRNRKIIEFMRGKGKDASSMVARTVFDSYFALNRIVLPDELNKMQDEFKNFWVAVENKGDFWKNSDEALQEIWSASKREADVGDKEQTARHGEGSLPKRAETGVWEWLRMMERGDA